MPAATSRDLATFEDVLGGRVVFAVESMGTRVAAVRLTDDPPLVLLTDHLEGDRPILVSRTISRPRSPSSRERLASRAHVRDPARADLLVRGAGGTVALYQLTRPEVGAHFEGRRDFDDQRRSRTTTGIERMPFVFSR